MKRLAGTAADLVFSAGVAHGYDGDTHYGLTYVLARAVGYTPEQACRIASADVAIDASINTTTEPVQDLSFLSDAFPPRIRFHAFRDVQYNSDLQADLAIQDQLTKLFDDIPRINNPGVYLHAYQDSYSHHGYWCRFGHYSPFDDLPVGAKTDYASYAPSDWPARNIEMATGTAAKLAAIFPASGSFRPRIQDLNLPRRAVGVLANANPTPSFFGPNVSKGWSALQSNFLANREGALPTIYSYALSDTGGVASPSAFWAQAFGITSAASVQIQMAPNRAGIGLGPGTLRALYWDPWTGSTTYLPFNGNGAPVDSAGGTVALPGFPVGRARLVFSTPYVSRTLDTVMSFATEKRSLTFDWDDFTVCHRDASKPLRFGNVSISGLSAKSNVHLSYPSGEFSAGFTTPYRRGVLRVYFGGFNGTNAACKFGSLGWNGFSVTSHRVELEYFQNGRLLSAAKGSGTFDLQLNLDGSATANYAASALPAKGAALSITASGTCAANSLVAFPGHRR